MDLTKHQACAGNLQELRSELSATLSAAYPPNSASVVAEALADPLFPLTFLLRNVMTLAMEPNWRRLPAKEQERVLLRLLQERSEIFCQVRDWLQQKSEAPDLHDALLAESGKEAGDFSYCTHCGGCCEIASGMPDFPAGTEIPSAWMNLFGTGLGPHHRFCPFLWEVNGEGLSLCAIHAWRPNPCRLFAEDECRYLMEDTAFTSSFDTVNLKETCSILCRLVNSRQPPA